MNGSGRETPFGIKAVVYCELDSIKLHQCWVDVFMALLQLNRSIELTIPLMRICDKALQML